MSDRASLAKARRELEEMYLGVPDDSVNLTFQDFAQVSQNVSTSSTAAAGKKKPNPQPPPPPTKKIMSPISESTPKHHTQPQHLAKLPSLDFSRALEASSTPHRHSPVVPLPPGRNHRHQVEEVKVVQHGYSHGHGGRDYNYAAGSHGHGNHAMKNHGHAMENSVAYDEMSMMSGMSMTSMYQDKVVRRRPGIPHSNICTVCGRVYCRQCLNIGMGEMTEGRKCIDCLGRKFSQRYIHRAGDVGCWSTCFNGYPSGVKIQELKWAEKGPRRSGQNMYNRSVMMSNSRSPLGAPRTPNRAHMTSGPPSFVTTPEYSPYGTPTHHHLPF